MNQNEPQSETRQPSPPTDVPDPARRRRLPGWVVALAIAAVALLALFAVALRYAVRNAEPILRRRVIATLEDRFRSPVELDALHVSVLDGLQVSGSGLRILNPYGPRAAQAGPQPMLSVAGFQFRTGVRQLLEPVMRIDEVRVQGMRLEIPPHGQRGPLLTHKRPGNRFSIRVDKIVVSDMILTIDTDKPGKPPLTFPIRDVILHDVGPGRAFPYEASLVNPKPLGDVRSTGNFGPWQDANPRDTPLDGSYSFTNADLATIKGISGTLSSTGKFGGTLGAIGVTGVTSTPNFAVDAGAHPVDLRTTFDATVDGTTGDTRLNLVHATLLHTVLNVSGLVSRANPEPATGSTAPVSGHFIDLRVDSSQARVEDLLTLAARNSPPLLQGGLTLHARLQIPPGRVSVSRKMRVDGTFSIRGATFANPSWQRTVDQLSQRAQGNPPEKADPVPAPEVASQMDGRFILADAAVHVSKLNYRLPGAQVSLAGKYSLDGQLFDFAGTVRTQATASAMLTGWKSIVAMPFDKLLSKNGAGLQVPITISGTKSAPKLGVDLGKLAGQVFSRHPQPNPPPQKP